MSTEALAAIWEQQADRTPKSAAKPRQGPFCRLGARSQLGWACLHPQGSPVVQNVDLGPWDLPLGALGTPAPGPGGSPCHPHSCPWSLKLQPCPIFFLYLCHCSKFWGAGGGSWGEAQGPDSGWWLFFPILGDQSKHPMGKPPRHPLSRTPCIPPLPSTGLQMTSCPLPPLPARASEAFSGRPPTATGTGHGPHPGLSSRHLPQQSSHSSSRSVQSSPCHLPSCWVEGMDPSEEPPWCPQPRGYGRSPHPSQGLQGSHCPHSSPWCPQGPRPDFPLKVSSRVRGGRAGASSLP